MDITPAYEGRITKYLRTVSLDFSGITVSDEIEAASPVEITYPLHSYVQPHSVGEEMVEIRRANASLTVIPIEGGLLLREISDKYAVDLNEGEPPEYHVTMPQQYHIYYKTEKAAKHSITVKYAVNIEKN